MPNIYIVNVNFSHVVCKRKSPYLCCVNSKLRPWRRTREFALIDMYRIFISHSWAYSSDYDKIESFLR